MDEQYVGRAPPALPLAACEGLELFFFFFPFRLFVRVARGRFFRQRSTRRRDVAWGGEGVGKGGGRRGFKVECVFRVLGFRV